MASTIGETAKSCQARSCQLVTSTSSWNRSDACERSAGYGSIRTLTSISLSGREYDRGITMRALPKEARIGQQRQSRQQ